MGYVLVKQSDGSYRSTKTNDNSRGEKVSQSEYNRRYGSSSSSSSKSSSNKSSSSRNSSSSSSSSSNRSSSSSSNSDAIQRLKDESTRIYNETGRWDTPRQLELKRQADQLRGYLTNDDGTRKIGELPSSSSSSSSSSRNSSSGSSSSSSNSSYNPFNTGINKDNPYNQFYNNYADVIRDIARKHNVDMGVAADMFRSDVRYGTGNNGKQYGDFTVTDEMRQAERKAYDDNYAQMDDRNRRIADQINSRQYTQKLTNALYGSTGSNVTGTTPNIDTSYTPTYSDDPAIAALQRRSYEIYKQTGRWDTPEQLELKRQADQIRGYQTNDDGTQYVGALQNIDASYTPTYSQQYPQNQYQDQITGLMDYINQLKNQQQARQQQLVDFINNYKPSMSKDEYIEQAKDIFRPQIDSRYNSQITALRNALEQQLNNLNSAKGDITNQYDQAIQTAQLGKQAILPEYENLVKNINEQRAKTAANLDELAAARGIYHSGKALSDQRELQESANERIQDAELQKNLALERIDNQLSSIESNRAKAIEDILNKIATLQNNAASSEQTLEANRQNALAQFLAQAERDYQNMTAQEKQQAINNLLAGMNTEVDMSKQIGDLLKAYENNALDYYKTDMDYQKALDNINADIYLSQLDNQTKRDIADLEAQIDLMDIQTKQAYNQAMMDYKNRMASIEEAYKQGLINERQRENDIRSAEAEFNNRLKDAQANWYNARADMQGVLNDADRQLSQLPPEEAYQQLTQNAQSFINQLGYDGYTQLLNKYRAQAGKILFSDTN